MLNTQELNIAEGHGTRLVCAGDVMGWLGGLPLALIEDVRMGRPATSVKMAQAAGNVGAMDCASGTGECGVGADCANAIGAKASPDSSRRTAARFIACLLRAKS